MDKDFEAYINKREATLNAARAVMRLMNDTDSMERFRGLNDAFRAIMDEYYSIKR